MKAYWGSTGIAPHILTSALDGGEWLGSRPGRLTPRERAPGTHWIGSWVGPKAVLDTVVKRTIPSPCWESSPRTPIIQPIDQHYTNWATIALTRDIIAIKIIHEQFSNILDLNRTQVTSMEWPTCCSKYSWKGQGILLADSVWGLP
jgi:hypothetical protein